MENPLMTNPEEENKAPAVPEAPAAAPVPTEPAKEQAEKKPFFTTGKIFAIIAGIVVIAAIVGALIYSQSSERFQGAAGVPGGTSASESSSESATAVLQCPTELGMVPSADGSECVCNTAGGVIENPNWTPPLATTGDFSPEPLCICPAGQTLDTTNATCILPSFVTTDEAKPYTGLIEQQPSISVIEVTIPEFTTETCESAFADMVTAYNNSNWIKYIAALSSYQTLNCTDACTLEIYKLIHDLSTGNTSSGLTRLTKYQTICPDCNMYFDLVSLGAEILSAREMTSESGLSNAEQNLFRILVEGYDVDSCQCVEIEGLLINPQTVITDYFPTATNAVTWFNVIDSTLRIAYADSYSSGVQSILQLVVDEKCAPVDVPVDCSSLTLKPPFDGTSFDMTDDFNPSTDVLEIEVDSDDNIADYKYESELGTVIFDETSADYNSPNQSVTLQGGPAEGESDIITVTAIEVTGLPLVDTCQASIEVRRPVVVTPVCNSLEIVTPTSAYQPGTPTLEMPSEGFVNETLGISLDAEPGSYTDLLYTSSNGDITFDGVTSLSTNNLTTLMNGGPLPGGSETVTVTARVTDDAGNVTKIDECTDSFTVSVPEEDEEEPPSLTYIPPEEEPPSLTYIPPEEEPPSLTYTPPPPEDEPPTIVYRPAPPTQIIEVPGDPTTVYVTEVVSAPPTEVIPITTTQIAAAHAAAPVTPETGPGLIIPLIGVAFGGAWLRRKKK
ncbi:hypothetical protein ACFLZH_04930 [Patescibacteria group bacterium]